MVRNKLFLVCLLALQVTALFSQSQGFRYIIFFTDKLNSPYSVQRPFDFLSERSLDRRSKQGISVVPADLPVTPLYVDSVLKIKGISHLMKSRWFNLMVISVEDTAVLIKMANFSFIREIQRLPGSLDKSGLQHVDKFEEVYGERFSKSTIEYGEGLNQIQMMNGEYLHHLDYTGKGKRIAVIDGGFSNVPDLEAFRRLREEKRIVGMYDFVDQDTEVFSHSKHGTLVLSTMAAWLPGELIGTAPDAEYILLRSEDGAGEDIMEEYFWAAAAEYADSAGADVLNTSLGYTTFDDAEQNHSYQDMDGNTTFITRAADKAAGKGMLVINSAGNSGHNDWRYISAPADGDSVLAVGAVDAEGSYAYFSSKGPSYDGRVKPNVSAQGLAAIVAAIEGGAYAVNGTSLSGPILAGLAACLWQAHPEAGNMKIFKAIEESASQHQAPDSLLGYGIPDFALAHLRLSGVTSERGGDDALIAVMPNPFTESLYLYIFSASNQQTTIELFDVSGRLVYEKRAQLESGLENLVKLDKLQDISAGAYILKFKLDGGIVSRKLIRQ